MSSRYFTKYLKESEVILRVVRRYPLSDTPSILLAIVFILLPFFFLFLLFRQGPWGVLVFFIFFMVGVGFSGRKAILWWLDAFLITNHRIIDFDRKGLFDQTVSETTYEKIQDVSFRKKGILATIFRYGTVVIQTAGTNNELEIKNVLYPEKIQELITEIQKEEKSINSGNASSSPDVSVKNLLKILEEIKKKSL